MSAKSVITGGLDIASATALFSWAIGLAPAIATVFTAAWTVLRTIDQLKKMGWIGKTPPPPSPYEPID